ncbi:50S ribosomal protein L30 [Candidatus Woesearchaeota archaeon]|nr:MAG: 50S ribosomal protein L30 [Candidatus Woesearchaeota archaeon]
MAKKNIAGDPIIEEIKKQLLTDKVMLGTERTLEGLKKGSVAKVYVSSNCPEETKKDIMYYADLSNAEVVLLKIPNDELGTVCKKPFSVSVLSVQK